MIKHIIWDFDGTLFDTYPKISYVFKNTLSYFDINEDQNTILKHLHKSLWHTYMIYVNKYDLELNDLRIKFSEFDEQMNPETIEPFPYVSDVIEGIEGKNFIFTHRGNSTFKYLKHWDYEKHFTEILTRESGYKRKPEPDALNYLINKYDLNKNETMYIGDREIDIKCAINANISSCYFDSHNIKIETKADYTINSFKDFTPWII